MGVEAARSIKDSTAAVTAWRIMRMHSNAAKVWFPMICGTDLEILPMDHRPV